MRWKIQLFRKVNRDLLPFDSLREEAGKLLEWVNRLYDERHWMAHGYVIPWKSQPGSWHFIKHSFMPDGSLGDLERTFTDGDLETLRGDLTKLTMAFAIYSELLANEVRKHGFDSDSG